MNYTKSSAILIRGEERDEQLIRNTMPWKMEKFPCKYLGLQLAIRQMTRSDWQPIVENPPRLAARVGDQTGQTHLGESSNEGEAHASFDHCGCPQMGTG